MKVILNDGDLVLEGTQEQVLMAMDRMGLKGDGILYNSGTKGWLVIKEMQSLHLRNAILKMYTEWVDDLHRIAEPKEVVAKILNGMDDPTFVAMLKELNSREV